MQETKIWRRRLHVISHRVSAFLTSLWEILITSCFTAVTIYISFYSSLEFVGKNGFSLYFYINKPIH